jgi:hypothetical protein
MRYFGFLLRLLFNPEEAGDIFLRKIGWLSTDYKALYHWWQNCSCIYHVNFILLDWSRKLGQRGNPSMALAHARHGDRWISFVGRLMTGYGEQKTTPVLIGTPLGAGHNNAEPCKLYGFVNALSREACSTGKKVKLSLYLALRHECVWESGCIDPYFLHPGTSWRWVVSFTPLPL